MATYGDFAFEQKLRRILLQPVTRDAQMRLGDMIYTHADVDQLAAKLDALLLSDGERAALNALLTFAACYPTDVEDIDASNIASILPRLLFEPALA